MFILSYVCENLATIAKPLHSLTEKGVPFDWSGECENAFKELKRALTEAPILNYSIEDGDFVIDTDASNVWVGGVLSKIQNGQETVFSYFSRCLSKCERRYCVTRKELLAVVATVSVKQFHHYLFIIYLFIWSHSRTVVRSDIERSS